MGQPVSEVQDEVEQPASPASESSADLGQPVSEVQDSAADVSESGVDLTEDMEQPAVDENDSVDIVVEETTVIENNNDTAAEAAADTTETSATIDDLETGQPESGSTKVKSLIEPKAKAGGFFSLLWLPKLFDLMSTPEVAMDVESLKKQAESVTTTSDMSDDGTSSSSDSEADEGPAARGGFFSNFGRIFGGRAAEPGVEKNVTTFNTYEDPKLHMLLDVMLIRCHQQRA